MEHGNETDLARALRRLNVAGDMAEMDKQTLAEYRDTIRDLRSQLAALQAEAARVVGELLGAPTAAGTTARDFLDSLPSPAVVAVPVEPKHDPHNGPCPTCGFHTVERKATLFVADEDRPAPPTARW